MKSNSCIAFHIVSIVSIVSICQAIFKRDFFIYLSSMNRFEKQLEKWNNGILRGAQSKLAKVLHVSTATIALWATGKRHPSKGYVAKMAQLFKLDEYSVSRLFTQAPAYNEILPYSPASQLYDADSPALHYPINGWIPNHTAVPIPVFNRLPKSFPHYTPSDALTWWILPPQVIQDAQYLFLLPSPQDSDRILFIHPSNSWVAEKLMLARRKNTYVLVVATILPKKIMLRTPNGQSFSTKDLEPLGIVIRQVVKPS